MCNLQPFAFSVFPFVSSHTVEIMFWIFFYIDCMFCLLTLSVSDTFFVCPVLCLAAVERRVLLQYEIQDCMVYHNNVTQHHGVF